VQDEKQYNSKQLKLVTFFNLGSENAIMNKNVEAKKYY